MIRITLAVHVKCQPKTTSFAGPSLGQRARGLVESLNIPAAEVAAVVVSGGIGNALTAKPNKMLIKQWFYEERGALELFITLFFFICVNLL